MLTEAERSYIERLEEALKATRRPIICSVFGMPEEEVLRVVTLIDATLASKHVTISDNSQNPTT